MKRAYEKRSGVIGNCLTSSNFAPTEPKTTEKKARFEKKIKKDDCNVSFKLLFILCKIFNTMLKLFLYNVLNSFSYQTLFSL